MMDIVKTRLGYWVTEHLYEIYKRRRTAVIPSMRRHGLMQQAKSLVICDRILTNRETRYGET
jgi:hypothetical protein